MEILVIFTGGTIGSSLQDGFISPNDDNRWKLINMYREATGDRQHFDIDVPYTALSENLDGKYLNKLIKCLGKHLESQKYDGIIITHGTDTLQYTSALLRAVFGETSIPIVFVSANYPLEYKQSNGLDNFIEAVRYIRSCEKTGVYVSYKNAGKEPEIHEANTLLRHHVYSDDVIGLKGDIDKERFANELSYEQIELDSQSPVLFLQPYPGNRYNESLDGVKAILFGSYHSGTLPTDNEGLKIFCKNAKDKGVPMYVCGMPPGAGYESTKYYDELGIEVLPLGTDIDWYMRLWLFYSNKVRCQEQ